MSDWQPTDPQQEQPFLGYAGPQTSPELPKGLAIAGMVCGIVSVVTVCVWFFAFPLAVTGLVLSLVAKSRVRAGTGEGSGLANAGIACSCVTLGLYAVGIGFFLVMMAVSRH
jgi:hypothetical protein